MAESTEADVATIHAGRVSYDPPLPARRDQLTQRMPQGTVIKTMAVYERPFWREEGLSGQATSDAGPARVVFDNSPPDGSPRDAARPERFVERVWAEEEWTRGCYGCLMTTGGWTEYGRALRAPIGPLYWAGAETATVWNGHMDGAVQSGDELPPRCSQTSITASPATPDSAPKSPS